MVGISCKMNQNKQNVQKLLRRCGWCPIEGAYTERRKQTSKQKVRHYGGGARRCIAKN